jgi:hypothetical protein
VTNEAREKGLTGEILGDGDSGNQRPAMELPLQMPPGVTGMQLGQALLGQIPYWGLKRSLDAYRRAVESGVQALRVAGEYYEARRELEMEKARWENRDIYRDAAALEAMTLYEKLKTAQNLAIAGRIDSQERVQAATDRQQAAEIIRLIEKNNREAENARAELRKLEAEEELADLKGGRGNGSFRKKLRAAEQAKIDYDEMMASKAEHIKEYGGEDKLPAYLRTLYENLEEDLGFRGS